MLPSDSCVWKWKASLAPEPRRALTTGFQLVPSGWMLQMPHWMLPRVPCDSSELKMIRPSFRMTGCRALADVEVADLLDVRAVVVHHEELQGIDRIAARRLESVAVADERDSAARQRAGVHVVHTVAQPLFVFFLAGVVARPIGHAGVRRERPAASGGRSGRS